MLQTKYSKLEYNPNRDIFFGKIDFILPEKEKEVSVIMAASYEYLLDMLSGKMNNENIDNWYKKNIEIWKEKNSGLFNRYLHYDIYSITEEGRTNILSFLKDTYK